MAKIYTKEKCSTTKMLPKKATVDFLLNFSKALKVEKSSNKKYEFILN